MCDNRPIRLLTLLAVLFIASPVAFSQNTPTESSPDLIRGVALYREGKYAEASTVLKKVVKQSKTEEQAWYYLGVALLRLKELKDATKALETALTLKPDSPSSHIALGYVLLLRNKSAVALHEALVALKIDPDLVDAHYISGVAYLRLGSWDLAMKEAENILRLDPKFANAYLLKSQALAGSVDEPKIRNTADGTVITPFSEAGDALEKYLQLNPNAEGKETLTQQLESLRFFEEQRKSNTKAAYSGREVTVKARILSKPEPEYTLRARRNKITGTVVLKAVLAADGRVKHIIVVSDLPDGLTEMAIAAARRIEFVPATFEGRPVAMFVQLEYNFDLY